MSKLTYVVNVFFDDSIVCGSVICHFLTAADTEEKLYFPVLSLQTFHGVRIQDPKT